MDHAASTPLFTLTLVVGLLWLPLAGCGSGDGLVVITPASYDFGRVLQGDLPTATLTVTNSSDRVVSLMPQPNCSCFAVEAGKNLRPLDPGDSMDVRVIFNTTTKPPGPVHGKFITFHLDHPKQADIVIPLKGEIFQSYTLMPSMFNLGRIEGSKRNHEPRVVTITPRSGYQVRLKRVAANPDVFDIEASKSEDGAKTATISISLRRGLSPRPLGAFLANVRLELELTPPDGPAFSLRPVVKITGYWAIKADGSAIPR